jgi:hypothetical protein
MEQQAKGLRMAAAAKSDLAAARAYEKAAQRPQLQVFDNEVEDNSPTAVSGGGKNEAGLARVVGGRRGRPRKAQAMAKSPSPSPVRGGAYKSGVMLREHLMKKHGGAWYNDFAEGLMSGVKSISNLASNIPGPVGMIAGLPAKGIEAAMNLSTALHGPVRRRGVDYGKGMRGKGYAGNQVEHARMDPTSVSPPGAGTGGQDVPPGGLAPVAYGNVPQAPASFQRNTVGMGKLTITHGGQKKAKRPASHRQQVVAQVMREKGMKLGEASKYVKEHGLA